MPASRGADEQRLAAGGAVTHRLAGKDEAETRGLLDKLVADDTLWPGATPRPAPTRGPAKAAAEPGEPGAPEYDEWTLLPDWEPPAAGPSAGSDYLRVKAPPPTQPLP